MGQECLNHLLMLHVYKEYTDELDFNAVANAFMSDSEHGLSTFGKF